MLIIDNDFIQKWAKVYNDRFRGGKAVKEEEAIRDWLSKQTEPKYLNKEYFVRLGRWKSARVTRHYELNEDKEIQDITRAAYLETDALGKLRLLMTLKGVGVPVASTIIHYMQPNEFPIFDYHCRYVLSEADIWNRNKDDASTRAWLSYVEIMRRLAAKLDVTLPDLDKALFAYHKRDIYCPNHYGDLTTNNWSIYTVRLEVE